MQKAGIRLVALLVLATGIVVAAISARALFGNAMANAPRVSIVGGADPSAAVRAQNSPVLAVDPSNRKRMLLAVRIDRPRFGCALYRSDDAGQHWNSVSVPLPRGYDTCYAPVVAFESSSVAYLAYLTLNTHPKDPLSAGNDPNGVWLMRSSDAGITFGTPRHVLGANNIQLRLAIDPESHMLVLAWLHGTELENHTPLGLGPPPNPLEVMISRDGGKRFSTPEHVNTPSDLRVGAPALALRNGRIDILFTDFDGDAHDYQNRARPFHGHFSLILARSYDGRHFTQRVVDSNVEPTGPFLIYLPPQPALAEDASGKAIAVAWQDGRFGAPDVLLRTSGDRGATWRAPVMLNVRERNASAAILPSVAFGSGDRLDAVYLEQRQRGDRLQTRPFYVFSYDGVRFSGPAGIGQWYDGYVGPISPRTGVVDLGTRTALAEGPDGPIAVWPDSRLGTRDTGRQDVAAATLGSALRSGIRLTVPVQPESGQRSPALRPPDEALVQPYAGCSNGANPRVTFVAFESTSEDVAGLRYFINDWGARHGCFRGRLVLTPQALLRRRADVVVVDIGYGAAVSPVFQSALRRLSRHGIPLAIFAQPALFGSKNNDARAVTSLQAIVPGVRFERTCANSQIGTELTKPFALTRRSFHDESFAPGVFDVEAPHELGALATDLCTTKKPTMIRTPQGVIAGFSLGYEVSLADDNKPAITAKQIAIDTLNLLAGSGAVRGSARAVRR